MAAVEKDAVGQHFLTAHVVIREEINVVIDLTVDWEGVPVRAESIREIKVLPVQAEAVQIIHFQRVNPEAKAKIGRRALQQEGQHFKGGVIATIVRFGFFQADVFAGHCQWKDKPPAMLKDHAVAQGIRQE